MIRLLHTGTPGATYEVRAASAWVDVTAAIEGPRGAGGAPGTNATGSLMAFLESATAPAAPTVSQDASNVLTFTGSWSLDYPATPTNAVYSIAVRYTLDSTARTIPAANVEGPFQVTGVDGSLGPPGAPGGGAIEEIGGWDTTIVAATDDIFLDLGFTWPDDTEYIAYFTEGDAAGAEPRFTVDVGRLYLR